MRRIAVKGRRQRRVILANLTAREQAALKLLAQRQGVTMRDYVFALVNEQLAKDENAAVREYIEKLPDD